LWSAICHQDTIYDATALAVPFIAELAELESVSIEGRKSLLFLLFAIGRGKSSEREWETACRRSVAAEARQLLGNREQFPRALRWIVSVLVIVAGAEGEPFAAEVAAEAGRDLDRFEAVGFEVVSVLVSGGRVPLRSLPELLSLDEELADYVAQVHGGRDHVVVLDDYFVDVLAERICARADRRY
jgi:hypothetical protein